MQIDANDPSLGEAMAQLASMEAQEAPDNAPQAESTETTDSVTTEQHAAQATTEQVQPTNSQPDKNGALATEKQQTEQVKEKPQSNFAKNQARLDKTWTAVNASKAEIAQKEADFKLKEESLARKVKALEEREAKLNQPKYKPEDYDKLADNYQKQVESLEAKGEYDRSEELKAYAKLAKEHAKFLRENPPKENPTDQDAQAQLEASRKEWMSKAAIDFPATAKPESEEGKLLRKLMTEIPGMLDDKQEVADPRALYYLARLANAEISAARVPKLDKELAGLHATVKELNEKLATPTDGAVVPQKGELPFNQKSQSEQEDDLYRMANEVDRRGF